MPGMPLIWSVHRTPCLAEVRLHCHVAATFARSLPTTAVPVAFQVPTRHSRSSIRLGSGSALTVAGIATRARVVARYFLMVIVAS
jgi:hypothetical protein